MTKLLPVAFAILTLALFLPGTAQAFDVRAGPIWNNDDAKVKCPNICQWYGGWNGNWTTTEPGKMSVCGCNSPAQGSANDANAGPIWSNNDAPGKCPPACQYYQGWNGQWRTTEPGKMSVCGCNESWH